MRFTESGPSIPDELLLARDEGRVVFFCGAGVSRARAGLEDFYGLAGSVLDKLQVASDHITRKVLVEAEEIHSRIGASGLISADRVFGFLERDFFPHDIQSAVANALKPKADVDLSAHKIILDLATTTDGKLRLVTTNFDRLFETACDFQPKIFQPSHLHGTVNWNDMNGIVHLHGIVDDKYQQAESDELILTSSQFGRAYLAEGWATRFFREILSQYIVVFIGYAADDPPVQYLLEALNKKHDQLTEVYAFQEGTENEAVGKWFHKGVQAISFNPKNNYHALWSTLEAWSKRASSPEEWYSSVIDLSKQGAKALSPFQRGQVAHVISTSEGAKRFAEAKPLPPAEWLCVFDPAQRYEHPGTDWVDYVPGNFINPFELYKLDDDEEPPPVLPHENYAKRDIPDTAWNAFVPNRWDHQNFLEAYHPTFLGYWANNPSRVCPRLRWLGVWLSKVADQPAAVWWAAKQSALHPEIKHQIHWEMIQESRLVQPEIRQAWRYLFEFWHHQSTEVQVSRDWQYLQTVIVKEGWSNQSLREYAALKRSFIKVAPNFWRKYTPPEPSKNLSLSHMLELEIEYPDYGEDIEITEEWLADCIKELRKNLEHSSRIEVEIGGYAPTLIGPVLLDGDSNIYYSHSTGLYGQVIFFSQLFERLVRLSVSIAQLEFAAWPTNDQSVFDRLRIWAAGLPELVSERNFSAIFLDLSDFMFWDSYSQRDLLLVLSRRWEQLSDESRTKLGKRLLAGRQKYDDESEQDYLASNTRAILTRLHWLAEEGCRFNFDLEAVTQRLRRYVPHWKNEQSKTAIDPMGVVRRGSVRANEDYSALLNENLVAILSKSQEAMSQSEDFLIENHPYEGLCKAKPVRAFLALTKSAKNADYPEWAWRCFLYSPQRKKDTPKFSALIAERIASYPTENLLTIITPACQWLKETGQILIKDFYPSYLRIVDKFITILEFKSPADNSSLNRDNKQVDWVFEAINSPVDTIIELLLLDPKVRSLNKEDILPSHWLSQIDRLRFFPNDYRRYALVLLASRLQWFYYWDKNWTEANLLADLDSMDREDQQAFWSGFLRSTTPIQRQTLYMRLKSHIVKYVKEEGSLKKWQKQQFAAILLSGWGTFSDNSSEKLISDNELHGLILHCDDDIRCHFIQLIKEWSKEDEAWKDKLLQFLGDVWPKQIVARTPRVSDALFGLAFSSIELFEHVADLVLLLLTPFKRPYLHISTIERISDTYPEQSLAIYYKAFSENTPPDLPHGLEQALNKIGDADKKLRTDPRWLHLKRKLDNK